MSYIKARNNPWKYHEKRGHLTVALSAYIRAVPGATSPELFAYEFKDGKYELMWHIKQGTKVEDLPWSKRVYQPYVKPHTPCTCSNCTS
jgi:hypothetical protein